MGQALPKDFFAAAVFFETKVEDAKEFSKAIDALSPLWESTPGMPTAGALILRGQTHPTKSAVIGTQVGDVPPDDESVLEHGHGFKSQNKIISKDSWECVTSFGFSENTFWSFLIDLVHQLNGWPVKNGKLAGPVRGRHQGADRRVPKNGLLPTLPFSRAAYCTACSRRYTQLNVPSIKDLPCRQSQPANCLLPRTAVSAAS